MSKRCRTETCPVCDNYYSKKNYWTRHHIFPKFWYNCNIFVEVCHTCHQVEFHKMFPMGNKPWSERTCISNWVRFCRTHKKNAFVIYPFLKNLQ